MLKHLFNFGRNLGNWIKQWTKPTTVALVATSLTDMTRSRADLIAENAILCQQLIVLKRQVKWPQLTHNDCFRLVLLARCTQFWQQALHIVQPDTLLRWYLASIGVSNHILRPIRSPLGGADPDRMFLVHYPH
jgi:hypothetical protein